MTIEDLAKQYASEKIKPLEEAIREAYIHGYDEGQNSLHVDSGNQKVLVQSKVHYSDIGLPSGTKWSVKPLLIGPYGKYQYGMDIDNVEYHSYSQVKDYNLPTVEQCLELIDRCEIRQSVNSGKLSITIKTHTDSSFFIYPIVIHDNCFKTWIRSQVINNKAMVLYIDEVNVKIDIEDVNSYLPCYFTHK